MFDMQGLKAGEAREALPRLRPSFAEDVHIGLLSLADIART